MVSYASSPDVNSQMHLLRNHIIISHVPYFSLDNFTLIYFHHENICKHLLVLNSLLSISYLDNTKIKALWLAVHLQKVSEIKKKKKKGHFWRLLSHDIVIFNFWTISNQMRRISKEEHLQNTPHAKKSNHFMAATYALVLKCWYFVLFFSLSFVSPNTNCFLKEELDPGSPPQAFKFIHANL